jgi:hypothetical protein
VSKGNFLEVFFGSRACGKLGFLCGKVMLIDGVETLVVAMKLLADVSIINSESFLWS